MEKNTLCTNKICVICVIFARTKFIIFPETFIFLFIHFFSEGGGGKGGATAPSPLPPSSCAYGCSPRSVAFLKIDKVTL